MSFPARLGLALTVMLAGATVASATTTSVRAEIRVPALQSLETTPGVLEAPPVTVPDLERGVLEVPQPVSLVISSNVPWELSVRRADSTGPFLEGSFEHGPFRGIGSDWSSLADGEGGTDRATYALDLRFAVDWTTADPGDHGLRLEYRLAPRER